MGWAASRRGQVGAFPWSSLDRRAPDQLQAPAHVRRQMVPRGRAWAFANACGRLLGRIVSFEVVATWSADETPSRPGDLSVVLSLGDAPGLALFVESALALRLASLAASNPLERADGVRVLEAEVVGAATAFSVLAARCMGAPWRLAGAELPKGPVACARAAVTIDDDVFELVAAVPSPEATPIQALGAGPLAALGVDVRALASLGDVPLSLPVVVAVTRATDDDLAALGPGAAWVPGETWTARRGSDGAWRGTALLAAPLADAGLVAEVDAGGQWRLGGAWRHGDHAPTESGTDEADGSCAVRVEAGEVTMPACAWADLAPGALLPVLARDAVTLRAGGDAMARGRVMTLNGEQVVLLEAMLHGKQGAPLRRLGARALQSVD